MQAIRLSEQQIKGHVAAALDRLKSDPEAEKDSNDNAIATLFQDREQLRAFVNCRNEVIAFALAMERRLRAKDHDRLASWKHKSPRALSIDLCSKAMALDSACIKSDHDLLVKHAVDVGNIAMFIADVARVLDPEDLELAGVMDLSPAAGGGLPA